MKTLQQIFESILSEDENKVKEYADKLSSSLGTDEFDKVHQNLTNDSSMKKEHIKGIITLFYGKNGSGTIPHSSRDNILRDIRVRHENLLRGRRMSASIGSKAEPEKVAEPVKKKSWFSFK